MEKKIKIGSSPTFIITWVLIIILTLGFCVMTVLGIIDFRSEEQIQLEHRESLINHDLFDEAMQFGREILDSKDYNLNKKTVKKISCLKISLSGNVKKAVLIELEGGNPSVCYATAMINRYVIVPSTTYETYKEHGRMISELILEGEDLEILYQEVENNVIDTMQ